MYNEVMQLKEQLLCFHHSNGMVIANKAISGYKVE